MFLPLGDYPNPTKPQWITRILIGINVAVFLFVTLPLESQELTEEDLSDRAVARTVEEIRAVTGHPPATRYDLLVWNYGYVPGRPDLLGLLFCMFLHAGWLHLLGNMLYLWIFGDNVEARLGPVAYVAAYLASGVVATLSFAVMNADSMIPLVGASGAISGVLGFYLLWYPHNQIRVLVFFFIITLVHIRALWVLGFYVVVDNLLPLLATQGQGGGVAYGAHLGGFLAGLAGAFLFNRVKGAPAGTSFGVPRPQRWSPKQGGTPQAPPERPAVTFDAAIRDGRMEDAAHAFARMAREGGERPDPDGVFKLARWLYENSFIQDAAAVFRYYIRNYPHGDDLDRVHLGLGILLSRRLSQPVAAREHLLNAIDLVKGDSAIAQTARDELQRIDT